MDLYFLQGWASDAPGKRHWFPPRAHNPVGASQQAWQAFGHWGGGGKGNAKWAHLLPFCLVEKLESRLRNEKLVVSKYNDLEGSTTCPCTCLWIFLAEELVGQWVRFEISLFSPLYSHPAVGTFILISFSCFFSHSLKLSLWFFTWIFAHFLMLLSLASVNSSPRMLLVEDTLFQGVGLSLAALLGPTYLM